jgi:hypothetical protein
VNVAGPAVRIDLQLDLAYRDGCDAYGSARYVKCTIPRAGIVALRPSARSLLLIDAQGNNDHLEVVAVRVVRV